MSVGEIPIDEVDAITGANPPGDLPVPASIPQQLSVNQLAQAATVPLNPAASSIDAELAKLPASLPAALPTSKTPDEAAARTAQAVAEAGEEKVRIAEEKAKNDQDLAARRQTFLKESGDARQKVLDAQELHRQRAETDTAESRAKAEGAQYHTLWATRSTGQKLAIAFGLIVGGASWNENHVNRGVEMLKSAMANDFEIQRQQHADLWRAVDEAQQGSKDLDARQLRDLSAFNANEGAKWDRVAGELGALIAKNKGRGDVNEAKKQALEAQEKANQYWQNSVAAAATAKHQSEADKEKARHDLEMEKAKRAKAAGAGGSSGGGAAQKAAVELREAIENAKAGKPVTDSKGNVLNPDGKELSGGQIDRLAFEKKIPPVAKAGKVSVKTILDSIKEGGAINKLEATIGDKDANLILYDPYTKEPIAKAGSVREKAALSKQNVQFADAATRVQELLDDIKKNGTNPTSLEAIQRRNAKYANAIIGVAVVSPLGKTNEAIHQEAASLGKSGSWDPKNWIVSLIGANPETVAHKVAEMKRLRQNFLNTVPITDEEKKKYAKGFADSAKSEGKWVEIPARLSDKPAAKGKKEMLISAEGKFLGEFR